MNYAEQTRQPPFCRMLNSRGEAPFEGFYLALEVLLKPISPVKRWQTVDGGAPLTLGEFVRGLCEKKKKKTLPQKKVDLCGFFRISKVFLFCVESRPDSFFNYTVFHFIAV